MHLKLLFFLNEWGNGCSCTKTCPPDRTGKIKNCIFKLNLKVLAIVLCDCIIKLNLYSVLTVVLSDCMFKLNLYSVLTVMICDYIFKMNLCSVLSVMI